MRRRLLLALVGIAVAAGGCGSERTPVPDVTTPAAASGERDVFLVDRTVKFTAPGSWTNVDPLDTLVGGVRSGTASMIVWRYPRTEPLPRGRAELRGAQRRLVAQVKQRDAAVKIDSQRVTRVAGAPAIELTTTQTVAGSTRRFRSVHVFKDRAEVVLDGSATPAEFDRIDETVYRPLIRSLRLRA